MNGLSCSRRALRPLKRTIYILLSLGLLFLAACAATPKTRLRETSSKNPAKSHPGVQPFDRSEEFNTIYEFLQTTAPDSPQLLSKPIIKKRVTREEIIRRFGEPAATSETGVVYDLSFSQTAETWTSSRAFLDFENNVLAGYHVLTEWGPLK